MNPALNLRAGEWVEVRSEPEILCTLDANGTLESLPFMPEMLEFCGKRFRVHKRADKACDTITWGRLRRMENAVHLESLRCNGQAHGGCQAGCLIYWKEAWLKRTAATSSGQGPVRSAEGASSREATTVASCTTETLIRATRKGNSAREEIFSCQATELVRATIGDIPWWEPRQYVRDVRSGNADVLQVIRGLFVGFFNKLQRANSRILPRLTLIHGGNAYPFLRGRATGKQPSAGFDLQPGELVEVKSKDEILDTLDERDRTSGLRFDREMLKYCGRQGRVLRRVQQIINEQTGQMLHINSDCITIDGFICTGDYHRSCPRSVYPYWRESWLKRLEHPAGRTAEPLSRPREDA